MIYVKNTNEIQMYSERIFKVKSVKNVYIYIYNAVISILKLGIS